MAHGVGSDLSRGQRGQLAGRHLGAARDHGVNAVARERPPATVQEYVFVRRTVAHGLAELSGCRLPQRAQPRLATLALQAYDQAVPGSGLGQQGY